MTASPTPTALQSVSGGREVAGGGMGGGSVGVGWVGGGSVGVRVGWGGGANKGREVERLLCEVGVGAGEWGHAEWGRGRAVGWVRHGASRWQRRACRALHPAVPSWLGTGQRRAGGGDPGKQSTQCQRQGIVSSLASKVSLPRMRRRLAPRSIPRWDHAIQVQNVQPAKLHSSTPHLLCPAVSFYSLPTPTMPALQALQTRTHCRCCSRRRRVRGVQRPTHHDQLPV